MQAAYQLFCHNILQRVCHGHLVALLRRTQEQIAAKVIVPNPRNDCIAQVAGISFPPPRPESSSSDIAIAADIATTVCDLSSQYDLQYIRSSLCGVYDGIYEQFYANLVAVLDAHLTDEQHGQIRMGNLPALIIDMFVPRLPWYMNDPPIRESYRYYPTKHVIRTTFDSMYQIKGDIGTLFSKIARKFAALSADDQATVSAAAAECMLYPNTPTNLCDMLAHQPATKYIADSNAVELAKLHRLLWHFDAAYVRPTYRPSR